MPLRITAYPDMSLYSTASIETMPNEVLGHILVYGTWDRTVPNHGTYRSSAEDPRECVLLVCKHWKEVALSTPSLWTVVELGPHVSLSLATLRMHRAGILPLCINLYTYDPRTVNSAHRMDAARLSLTLDTILPYSHRWLEFHFSSDETALMSTVCRRLPTSHDVPSMRSFHLKFALIGPSSTPFIHRHGLTLPLFSGPHPPVLLDVELSGCGMPMSTMGLHGLQRLVLQESVASCTLQQLQQILGMSPNLEDLEIAGACFQAPLPEDANEVIVLHHLRQLSIGNLHPGFAKALLRSLVIPILQKLTINLHCALRPDAEAFDAFVHGLQGGTVWSTLRELDLRALTCQQYAPPSSSIPSIFHAFPYIETLTLSFSDTHLPMIFWRALFHEPACVLPHLRSLTIRGLSLLAAQEFIMARHRLRVPLQNLVVHVDSSELVAGRMQWLEKNVPNVTFHGTLEGFI